MTSPWARRQIRWFFCVSLTLAACTPGSEAEPTGEHGGGDTTSSSAGPTPPQAPSAVGPAIGLAVPGGTARGVAAVEESIGSEVELVRLFFRWDEPFPDSDVSSLVAGGHTIHVSVRPRTVDGTTVRWAELATAEPGSAAYGQLVSWVDRLATLPAGTYVTINHEPETRDSAANGSSDEFVEMWRRFARLLDERDADHLQLVWTMTGGAFRDGRADIWYPGDDVVDVVGADLYNWFTCQGTSRDWIGFERLLVEPLAFAAEHAKPLAVPEAASVEDPAVPGRKGQWIDGVAAALSDPGTAEQVLFVAWFDVTAPGGTFPNCVWDHDTSPASAEAFGRLVREFSPGG